MVYMGGPFSQRCAEIICLLLLCDVYAGVTFMVCLWCDVCGVTFMVTFMV